MSLVKFCGLVLSRLCDCLTIYLTFRILYDEEIQTTMRSYYRMVCTILRLLGIRPFCIWSILERRKAFAKA